MTGLTFALHMQLHTHEHKMHTCTCTHRKYRASGSRVREDKRALLRASLASGPPGTPSLLAHFLEARCGDYAFGLAPASAPPIILGLEHHPCIESFCGDHCQSQLAGSVSFLFILLWGYSDCVFFHVKAAISSDEIKCSLHGKLAL